MYVYGKMRSLEFISGMGEGRTKENDVRGEFSYHIL
jgi:hypothetical protein